MYTYKKRAALLGILLAIIAIVLYLVNVVVSQPFIGAEIVQTKDGNYEVKQIEPAGQALIKGIQQGDRVLLVNGQPAGLYKNVIKFGTVEMAETIRIERPNGVQEDIQFTGGWSGDHSNWEKLIQLYIPLASFVLFFSLSIFLYMQRRNDRAALMLMLFFVAIGLSYFSSVASYRSEPFGISIMYILIPNIPTLFMLFMNKYLERFSVIFISKKALIIMFFFSAAISISCLFHVWTDLMTRELFLYISNIFYGSLIIGNFIIILQLFRKFIFYRNTKHNSLFKITLISQLVAFTPFTTMNLLPLFIGGGQLLPAAFTSLFLFVLPIVYFYLLTSNQLFDIDFILTRFKYYTLLSLFPSAAITTIILLIIRGDGYQFAWSQSMLLFLVVYAGIIVFLYLKEQIDHRFRPKLFKAMYSYQDSLDRFSRKIARVMKQSDLEEVLRREIDELLPVNRVSFLLVDGIEKEVYPIGNDMEELITAEFLLAASDSLQIGELIDLPYGLGLVIGRQRSRYHVLWIGNKTNHTRFNSDELRWLKTMSNYASIVFENLYLIEGLIEDLETEVSKEHTTSPWVLRLLFCLSENERRKLAADLHDSALQDQLLWYRRLEALMIDHPMSDKLEHELEDIKEGLLDVIHQIRETCNELRPPLLKEMGVVEAVESIIEHTQMRVNFAVDFKAKPYAMPMNEEQITAIYRIVQELLRNADKHSGAKLVAMELEQRDDNVYFRYQDDGIGMDVNGMVESFEHMGLSGIKERVKSLEGEITFDSQPGKGLEVVIIFPLAMTTGYSERGIMRDSYLIS